MNDKFFVVDGLLTQKEHEELFNHLRVQLFTSNWSSTRQRQDGKYQDSWHWNYTFFQAQLNMPAISDSEYQEMITKHPPIDSLWDKASNIVRNHVGKYDILRLYANCNPYGTNAYIHKDDGDYTMVYYPALKWDAEWEGGTCFYEQDINGEYDAIRYVSYKPNRLVLFPAHIPHRGMPVDRACTDPRFVIAMKLQRDVNDPLYFQEYYNAKST